MAEDIQDRLGKTKSHPAPAVATRVRHASRAYDHCLKGARGRVIRQEQAVAYLARCGPEFEQATVRAQKRLAVLYRALDALLQRRSQQGEAGQGGGLLGAGWWRPEPGGGAVAETEGLRLVVHPLRTPGGYVRFLVLRRGLEGTATHALVASGSEESVPAAMRAAERVAARITLSS